MAGAGRTAGPLHRYTADTGTSTARPATTTTSDVSAKVDSLVDEVSPDRQSFGCLARSDWPMGPALSSWVLGRCSWLQGCPALSTIPTAHSPMRGCIQHGPHQRQPSPPRIWFLTFWRRPICHPSAICQQPRSAPCRSSLFASTAETPVFNLYAYSVSTPMAAPEMACLASHHLCDSATAPCPPSISCRPLPSTDSPTH